MTHTNDTVFSIHIFTNSLMSRTKTGRLTGRVWVDSRMIRTYISEVPVASQPSFTGPFQLRSQSITTYILLRSKMSSINRDFPLVISSEPAISPTRLWIAGGERRASPHYHG